MEQLLILKLPANAKVRQSIEDKARVVQEASDKLLVIEGSTDAIQAATRLPGVTTVDLLAADAANTLSPAERLFVAAWRQRHGTMSQKVRIGEGLSWGAKGFKSP
jgi:hypothetical protein